MFTGDSAGSNARFCTDDGYPEVKFRCGSVSIKNALVVIDGRLPGLCATRKLSSNLFFWVPELTAIRWRRDLGQREKLLANVGVNMLSKNKLCASVTRFLRGI
jgi:hypothetical protein